MAAPTPSAPARCRRHPDLLPAHGNRGARIAGRERILTPDEDPRASRARWTSAARIWAPGWWRAPGADPAFKARLLADGTRPAPAEMGIEIAAPRHTDAWSRTRRRHPQRGGLHPLLLLSAPGARPAAGLVQEPRLRSRAVREPRAVLRGVRHRPRARRLRVHNSTADMRYLVLPRRPPAPRAGANRLAALVGRDSMIGVAVANAT